MEKTYTVEKNQVVVSMTIPKRTITERVVSTRYSIEQVQSEIERLTAKITPLQTELSEWQAIQKAAVDGGVKTKEELAVAAEVVKVEETMVEPIKNESIVTP